MTASGRGQLTLLIRTSVPFRWIATNTSFANAAAVGFSTNIRSKGVPSTQCGIENGKRRSARREPSPSPDADIICRLCPGLMTYARICVQILI